MSLPNQIQVLSCGFFFVRLDSHFSNSEDSSFRQFRTYVKASRLWNVSYLKLLPILVFCAVKVKIAINYMAAYIFLYYFVEMLTYYKVSWDPLAPTRALHRFSKGFEDFTSISIHCRKVLNCIVAFKIYEWRLHI